jgi:hypothetical protein
MHLSETGRENVQRMQGARDCFQWRVTVFSGVEPSGCVTSGLANLRVLNGIYSTYRTR